MRPGEAGRKNLRDQAAAVDGVRVKNQGFGGLSLGPCAIHIFPATVLPALRKRSWR